MSAVGLRTSAGSFDERVSPRAARRCFGVFAVLLVGLALMAAPARADFAAGVAAYDAGNYAKAYAEFLPLARGGDSAAQYSLGNMYRRGQGMARDNAEAVRWYRKAADQGNGVGPVPPRRHVRRGPRRDGGPFGGGALVPQCGGPGARVRPRPNLPSRRPKRHKSACHGV